LGKSSKLVQPYQVSSNRGNSSAHRLIRPHDSTPVSYKKPPPSVPKQTLVQPFSKPAVTPRYNTHHNKSLTITLLNEPSEPNVPSMSASANQQQAENNYPQIPLPSSSMSHFSSTTSTAAIAVPSSFSSLTSSSPPFQGN